MAAVESLCTTGILLSHGRVEAAGAIDDVVAAYSKRLRPSVDANLETRHDRRGSGRAVFTGCGVVGETPDDARTIRLRLSYRNDAPEPLANVKVSVVFRDAVGQRLVDLTNNVLAQRIDLAAGTGDILLDVFGVNLGTGIYSIDLLMAADLTHSEVLDEIENAIAIEIDNNRFYSTHRTPPTHGVALLDFRYHSA